MLPSKEIMNHITVTDKTLFVTSRFIAEKFEKSHKDVIKAIKALECSEEFSRRSFTLSDFHTERGRTYQEYKMTRDGFMFLCMGFTGREAAAVKESFIEAFNAMESILLQQAQGLEWKTARTQIKMVRRSFTDTVKEFVDYAKAQGSKSADRYYANLTKMEYSALELVSMGGRVPENFRDTLDLMELSYLTTAEQVCRRAIAEAMKDGMHYKDVYTYAKLAVCRFAEGLKLPQLR